MQNTVSLEEIFTRDETEVVDVPAKATGTVAASTIAANFRSMVAERSVPRKLTKVEPGVVRGKLIKRTKRVFKKSKK